MRGRTLIIVLLAAAAALAAASAAGEMASRDEARRVAENWVSLVVASSGHWGAAQEGAIVSGAELSRNGVLLGYAFGVAPAGFIVVSSWKELAAVKAYSEIGNLDPASDEGVADLIKRGLERPRAWIQARRGATTTLQQGELEGLLEVSYRPLWKALAGDPATFRAALGAGMLYTNYAAGQILTTTHWEQGAPYNDLTPAGATCTHTLVGCVATAGAQLMRYWAWPPYGVGSPYDDAYDWGNMPNVVTTTSAQAEIDAVAELSYEVAVAVGMQFGCAASSAATSDMEGVYESTYRYSTAASKVDRSGSSVTDWFDRIKGQLDLNRPVHYRIPGHSVVADGWREIWVGGALQSEYHINYGWGTSGACSPCDAWYAVDGIYGGNPNDEYILENIYPAPSLGASLAGTYATPASFPYRYFDQDASGGSATFSEGQYLQFLDGVKVTCTGSAEEAIRFEGGREATWIYSHGIAGRGAKIGSAEIVLRGNGGMRLP